MVPASSPPQAVTNAESARIEIATPSLVRIFFIIYLDNSYQLVKLPVVFYEKGQMSKENINKQEHANLIY